MVALVMSMILCLLLGLAVVLAVAVVARRDGRDVLTPHGEGVVAWVRERSETVAVATRDRTGGWVSSAKDAKDKVVEALPGR
ncbi:MAG: hypothetical protein WAR57_15465 [Candidatus Phosphoribacter sp.]|nr:hypothetical protein [Actinomycetales bacterium]